MSRNRLIAHAAAVLAVAVFAVGQPLASASVGMPAPTYLTCPSKSLGGKLPAAVYLPAGYSTGTHLYPVIYFLHGLPAGPSAYKANGFVAQAVAASGHDAIVVAPQGARSRNSDREYLNWGPRENWPRAISLDLPRCIDARFNTIANRRGRALVGVSAGGFGAFNIGLRNLREFAAVESWSGYFAATDPSGYHVLKFSSREQAAQARVEQGPALAGEVGRYPSFIGFYVGRQDQRFYLDNVGLNRSLNASHISHWFATYTGSHSLSMWASEAPLWLGRALAHLTAPQSQPAPPGAQ